mmetsp:Transcript_23333/g.36015  ORF Transcript_23333/g.36015 Transcript_23333/m.36015 type:complete len:81 (-) Transcript_23333:5537-5779(-)
MREQIPHLRDYFSKQSGTRVYTNSKVHLFKEVSSRNLPSSISAAQPEVNNAPYGVPYPKGQTYEKPNFIEEVDRTYQLFN